VADFVLSFRRAHARRQHDLAVGRERARQRGKRRHYANDRVWRAVHTQSPAECFRVSTEAAAPHPVPEDDCRCRGVAVFPWIKSTSDLRRHSEQREQGCGDSRPANAFGIVIVGHGERIAGGECDASEAAQLTPRCVVERCGFDFEHAVLGQRLPDEHKAIGVAVQRPQQKAVEQREYRAVHAQTERERQNDDSGEPRTSESVPAGEPQVRQAHSYAHDGLDGSVAGRLVPGGLVAWPRRQTGGCVLSRGATPYSAHQSGASEYGTRSGRRRGSC
jgi:hypothetical protein